MWMKTTWCCTWRVANKGYSKVMPVARFAVCLLLAVCASAATAPDLLGRYGTPLMQRFAAGNCVVVGIEYDKGGHVTTMEIAPGGFQ